MNTLHGNICDIQVNGGLSLVKVKVGKDVISTVILETPESASYLVVDNPIKVVFKETEVAIGKGSPEISLQNRISGRIEQIDPGKLLSRVRIATDTGPIDSVITTNAVDQLELSPGMEVITLVKTNEIMLSE